MASYYHGFGIGAIMFLLTLVALTYFYVEPQTGPASFLGIAYYGVPFLLASTGFAGYTAQAISPGC